MVYAVYSRLSDEIAFLRRDKWVADAASDYYLTMERDVLPGIARLATSLRHASQAMLDIIQIFQDAETAAANALPGMMDDVAGGGDSALWAGLGDWIRSNRDTFRAINDYLGVVPFKETAAIMSAVFGTPLAGVLVYTALFGVQTGFTYLEHFGENPGGRGGAIAVVDTVLSSLGDLTGIKWIEQMNRLKQGLQIWDGIDTANNWLQLIGNQGASIAGVLGDAGVDPALVAGLQSLADRVRPIGENADLGDLTYAASTQIVDATIFLSQAAAGGMLGSSNWTDNEGFAVTSRALGIEPSPRAHLPVSPRLDSTATNAPLSPALQSGLDEMAQRMERDE